jgi:hypothetical protein
MTNLGLMMIAVVIGVGIFVISRQLTLWYWRLTEMASNLAYIANHYRIMDQVEGRHRAGEVKRDGYNALMTPRSKRYPGINQPPSSNWSNN